MKKKITNLTTIIFILFIIVNIFTKTNIVNNSISFSITLFIKNIFPSLFPMFILSSLFISLNIPSILGDFFSNFFIKLFNVKGISAFVFFMSMISGFPSSGKYINELLKNNEIDEEIANKTLYFTFFGNPLFIVNTVGNTFLNNKNIGYIIIIASIISNIIVGILFKNLYKTNYKYEKINFKKTLSKFTTKNIISDFFNSIKDTIMTLLNIFGTITCFIILINLLNININPLLDSLIKGLIESTTGLKYLSLTNIPYKLKVYTSTFIISFGGLSIHCQIFNILKNHKISYYPFLLARIIQACISTIIVYIIINII